MRNRALHQDTARQLQDTELAQILLGSAASAMLLRRTGSVMRAMRDALQGHGPSQRRLVAAMELARRCALAQLTDRQRLSSPAAVRDYLVQHYNGLAYETFLAIYLDSQHGVLAVDEAFRGTLTQTSVYPREIARRALEVGAAGAIFSHQHPSGVETPSEADRVLTRELQKALRVLDITVIDHIIVAGPRSVSFAELGML